MADLGAKRPVEKRQCATALPETGRQRQSRRSAAAVVCLEIRLLGKNKRVIYLDPEITNRTL
jgi:hypothetical protein